MTTAVIPTDAAELEAMLADPKVMRDVVSSPAEFGEFIKNYANTITMKDQNIGRQIKEETQRVLAQMARDARVDPQTLPLNMNPLNARPTANKGQLHNHKAPGAMLDDSFESSAEYLQTIWPKSDSLRHNAKGELNAKLDRIKSVQNSFGSVVPGDGGFLIPETLRSQLLQVALESAVVRPRATVIPMETLRVPIPMVDSTTNATSVFGGIVAYWTEEGGSLVESQASFGRVVLEAKKLTAFALVPNELVADGSAFGGFLDQTLPKAISWYEDKAFMTGTGVGEPLGWINCPASVPVAAEAGQTSGTIVYQNLVKMYSRMLPSSLANAVWIANIDTFPELATMALSVGTGGSAVWIGAGGAVGAPPVTIFGRPVIFTEKASTLGTTGDINFVDLSYYLLGDRQIMQAESSIHYKFQNDQTAYRIIERVDGRPWLQSAITPASGSSNTLSPFVQLATR